MIIAVIDHRCCENTLHFLRMLLPKTIILWSFLLVGLFLLFAFFFFKYTLRIQNLTASQNCFCWEIYWWSYGHPVVYDKSFFSTVFSLTFHKIVSLGVISLHPSCGAVSVHSLPLIWEVSVIVSLKNLPAPFFFLFS